MSNNSNHDLDILGEDVVERNVLVISYQYPPCASSGVFRTLRFVKHLPDFHWVPVILTIAPHHYTDEPLDVKLSEKNPGLQALHVYQTEVMPGADRIISFLKGNKTKPEYKEDKSTGQKVAVTRTIAIHERNSWNKIKDAITLSLMIPDKRNGWLPFAIRTGLTIIKKESPSLLYASGGPWTSFLIGYILKKMSGLPLIIDFRDPWVDNPYNEYVLSFRDHVNAFLEKKCVTAADWVLANTEPLRALLVEKYSSLPPDKFMTLTNGYDEDEFTGMQWHEPAKVPNAPLVISHVGSLYSRRSPEKFLDAVARLIQKGKISTQDVIIQFIGKVDIPDLKAKVAQGNLASIVKFIDHLPKQDALTASLNSDILLLIQPATRLQVPAKLFEYIRLGRPIFAVCGVGATEEIVTANDFGTVAQYDDVADIEHKFYALYTTLRHRPEDCEHQGSNLIDGRIKQFDASVLTSQLARVFDRLAGK